MADKEVNKFDDPLEDIDPVMAKAFSVNDDVPPEESAHEESAELFEDPPSEVGSHSDSVPNISQIEFPELSDEKGSRLEEGLFSSIPVKISVELGRSNLTLKEVYELSEGSIIELNRLVGEPLDLVINGQVLAQGEVVAIDNKYGLRIKTLDATPTSTY